MGKFESPAYRAALEILQRAGDRLHDHGGAELLADAWATDCLMADDRVAAIEKLVQEAESDVAAHDAATRLATWLDYLGDPIPAVLQQLVDDVEGGTRKRPIRRGPTPYKRLPRDGWIVDAIIAACSADSGISPMRNDTPRLDPDTGEDAPPHSACDIVSECLIEKMGVSLSYDGVKAVWKRHMRWRKALAGRLAT